MKPNDDTKRKLADAAIVRRWRIIETARALFIHGGFSANADEAFRRAEEFEKKAEAYGGGAVK